MSKSTYYIVQVTPRCYASGGMGEMPPGLVRNEADAERYTLSMARRVRQFMIDISCGEPDGASRFPRIMKVSTEMKTIKERR